MVDYRISGLVLAFVLGACGGNEPEPIAPPSVDEIAAKADAATNIRLNPDKNAYFGDLHVHTKNSFDAYIFGTRSGPDDAYRFAKGEAIRHDGGYDIKLGGPPLDFLAVTDHGEYLGVVRAMQQGKHRVSQTETSKSIFGLFANDRRGAFLQVGATIVSGEEIDEIYDRELMDSVWADTVAATQRHYEPGKFTTFSGYEFTAMRQLDIPDTLAAANLHRNVIFRDGAPDRLFTTLDSTNPEDLWGWMDTERGAGRDVLSIPHNSNASNGEMFAAETYEGQALNAEWSALRKRNEPIVEVTQLKGTSETHPSLSPNDEFSGFEQYEYFIGSAVTASVNIGDFVRPTYGRGLEMEAADGFNPYEFGLIGSSDTHISAATLVEETHWGKFPTDGESPEARLSVPPDGKTVWPDETPDADPRVLTASQFASSGLAGVWAEANTREAIFDSMQRKETFGTSGPRMRVRLFAGVDYSEDMLAAPDMVAQAYARGVPMGGELAVAEAEAPVFLGWALQDALSAPLQRMQMVKVSTVDGKASERIYDIACGSGDAPDPATRRCADNGASVSVDTCQTEQGAAASELKTLWRDPDFVSGENAVYYLRVLENPTCRWSTWDAIRNGTPPNPKIAPTLQERAWTSPVFVKGG